MKILKEVLEDIKPSAKDKKELKQKINLILKILNSSLKDARAVLGGSGAKDTWLKGVKDADIFVLYNYSKYKDRSDQLSDILHKTLKKNFKNISRVHGSRDYFQIKQGSFLFEIIPILNIKDPKKAMNITDISPLHASFVKKHSKLADEIRLLKQFCKANNCYGAESYIGGFSGYACEVLIIYYGSFMKLARRAARWKPKVIIDYKKYYKRKNPLDELNTSKLQSPIVMIDPVQKTRNVTAALSEEKFNLFKKICQKFLKKPSKEFFREKEFSLEKIKNKAKGKNLILIDVKALPGKKDVVGSKLAKAFRWIIKKTEENDFKIISSGWEWDEKKLVLFWIMTKKEPLSGYKEIPGPKSKVPEKFKKDFRKKHKNTFKRKGKLYAKVKRDFTDPEQFIKKLIKTPYIKEKVKSIRCQQ